MTNYGLALLRVAERIGLEAAYWQPRYRRDAAAQQHDGARKRQVRSVLRDPVGSLSIKLRNRASANIDMIVLSNERCGQRGSEREAVDGFTTRGNHS